MAADMIGHNPHIQLLYLSHSRHIALRQSRLVKRMIETPQYQEVFPWIRPGMRWADTDWEIDKHHAKRWFPDIPLLDSDATLTAVSALGSIIGLRTHAVLCDDIIKSSAAIANGDVREKMEHNLFEVVEPTLIPGGRMFDIGTLFRRDDIHHRFKEEGWQVIHTSALLNDAKGNEVSYWPERFKVEALQHIRQKRETIFLYQFQNTPPPDDEDVIIKPEWIKYGEMPERFDRIVVGVDLAASEEQLTNNDWTVFVVAGVKDKGFHLIDNRRGRWVGNEEKLGVLRELWQLYGDCTNDFVFCVETNAYQRSLLGDYKTIFVDRWRIPFIKVRKTPSKGDKHERLNGISGIFANGLVTLNQEVNWRQVVSEMTFQELEHDDCADATEKALNYLQRRKPSDVWGA